MLNRLNKGTPVSGAKDACGRQVQVGDHLRDAAGHNYHVDDYGQLRDVAGLPVRKSKDYDNLTITYRERISHRNCKLIQIDK